MNIILEGCDGTGKTTLANYLCQELGCYYWHESVPRTKEEYTQMLSSGNDIVFDRFCYGQFVYNQEAERKLSLQDLVELQATVFQDTKTIVLYVDADSETIAKRMESRNEYPAGVTSHEKLVRWVKNIRGTYRSLFQRAGTKFININGVESKL